MSVVRVLKPSLADWSDTGFSNLIQSDVRMGTPSIIVTLPEDPLDGQRILRHPFFGKGFNIKLDGT